MRAIASPGIIFDRIVTIYFELNLHNAVAIVLGGHGIVPIFVFRIHRNSIVVLRTFKCVSPIDGRIFVGHHGIVDPLARRVAGIGTDERLRLSVLMVVISVLHDHVRHHQTGFGSHPCGMRIQIILFGFDQCIYVRGSVIIRLYVLFVHLVLEIEVISRNNIMS